MPVNTVGVQVVYHVEKKTASNPVLSGRRKSPGSWIRKYIAGILKLISALRGVMPQTQPGWSCVGG
jgi:hypothetical protein